MEISIIGQSTEFLLAGLYGVVIGLLYDVISAIRGRIRIKAATYLFDILFWVICVAGVFWFAMGLGQGELRLFVLGGIIAGNILYFNIFSPFIRSLLFELLELIIKAVGLLLAPFGFAFGKSKKVAQKMKKSFHFMKKKNRIKEMLFESELVRQRVLKTERRMNSNGSPQDGHFYENMYRDIRGLRGTDAPYAAGADKRAQSYAGRNGKTADYRPAEERSAQGGYRV